MPNSRTIAEWQRVAHENAIRQGFHGDGISNIWTMLGNMHCEISEAWEEARHPTFDDPTLIYWIDHEGKDEARLPWPEDVTDPDRSTKPEGLPIELADLAIRLFDVCEHLGIDLEKAVALKHAYNLKRPFRHGGKKI